MRTRVFVLSALALLGAMTSCKDDGPQESPKSSESRMTSFTARAEGFAVKGFIDQAEKTVELSYMDKQLPGLKSATADVVISENATISPDPSVVTDYTVAGGVEFTVTAEDGVSTTVYTVYIAEAQFSEKCTKVWEKTFDEMGLHGKPNFDCGIAFVDVDKFAYCDLRVFDLDGEYLGSLNIDGMPEFGGFADSEMKTPGQIGAMTNDVNGVLVGAVTYTGTYSDGSTGCVTDFYAWKDGWDKAPVKIYGPFEWQCMYISVSGDVNGDFILNFRTSHGNPQMHHVLVFKGGQYFKEDGSSAATWFGPFIQHPGNDGCWGQMLSFFSGDPEDGFVCWDSTRGEYEDTDNNATSAFYVYPEGLSAFMNGTATEIPLYGRVNWSTYTQVGGPFGYGNYSIGHVRAFKYNGVKYLIACSSSWPNTWITVQKAEDIAYDDEETDEIDESDANYLLVTDIIENTDEKAPCCAYVYDPATTTGHIVYAAQSVKVVAYNLETKVL